MRVLCVGGGSGGHVTPIVAVVEELRCRHSELVSGSTVFRHPESDMGSKENTRDPLSDYSGKGEESDRKTTSAAKPTDLRVKESLSQIQNQISTGSSNLDLNHKDSFGKSEPSLAEDGFSNSLNPEIRIWVDKKFATQTRDLIDDQARVDVIASGKLRRYANLTWQHRYLSWYHLTRTHLPNLVDFFKIIGGFFQSLWKLILWRPNVVFAKGGYVCLPVGMAARFLRIPLVIHDSDSVPGLTNRILARWAAAIGTGSKVENYPSYPRKRTKFVGIPVRPEIKKLDGKEKRAIRKSLNLNPDKKLIFVMGGGGGAQIFADTFQKIAPEIVRQNAQIVLSTGKGKLFKPDKKIADDFKVYEFITDKYAPTMNACDIFVTRAGVTGLAEAATVGVPTIIVPSPYLSGDHQTKNAAVYEQADAAVVLKQLDLEKDPEMMTRAIGDVLNDSKLRARLKKNLAQFAKPDALNDIVQMILTAGKSSQTR